MMNSNDACETCSVGLLRYRSVLKNRIFEPLKAGIPLTWGMATLGVTESSKHTPLYW